MSNIRIDEVSLSTLHEAFKNREKKTASINVSGSITGGSHKTFSTDVPIIRDNAMFEPYYKIRGGSKRRKGNTSNVCLDVSWSHNVYLWFSVPSENVLRITIDVDNPSSTKSIATQTVDFTIYVFDTPFS